MIFSYFLWSYVLCLTGWRWALTRGIERVFPHLSVSNMILCLAAVYITLVTCWCILSGFLCRLMQRNVPKQRFCIWDKYLELDQVNSANLLFIFWPLLVLLCSFEKNNWSAEEKRNGEGRGGKYLVYREEEEGTRNMKKIFGWGKHLVQGGKEEWRRRIRKIFEGGKYWSTEE